jgi:hypothetical protein
MKFQLRTFAVFAAWAVLIAIVYEASGNKVT